MGQGGATQCLSRTQVPLICIGHGGAGTAAAALDQPNLRRSWTLCPGSLARRNAGSTGVNDGFQQHAKRRGNLRQSD